MRRESALAWALIPARGGSAGIPGKNLMPVGGRELIAWTIDAALAARSVGRVIVSTDDEAIAARAVDLGAEVPFLRPAHIATDEAPALSVLRHALQWVDQDATEPELVAYLQPTSPLRTARHIDAAVARAQETGADGVVSIVAVPHALSAGSTVTVDEHMMITSPAPIRLRRQEKPLSYARNGPAVLVLRSAHVRTAAGLYDGRYAALEMPRNDSIDIDDPEDVELADALLSWRKRQGTHLR